METIPEVWERLQDYIQACPHHGIEGWLVLQNFYNGLTAMSKGHIDAAAGGAFLSLTVEGATALIEKMVSNQWWGEKRSDEQQEGMHTEQETDMLATKMDLLLKNLDECVADEEAMYGTVKAIDSHMTCEVCGDVGHSGNDCLETRGDTAYINGFRQQGGHKRWNNQSHSHYQGGNSNINSNYNSKHLSWKELVLDQAKIIENLTEKLMVNDKMLELMNSKIEGLTSFIKNQLSFNKMIEAQLAQIIATIPVADSRKFSGQQETYLESAKTVLTRFGKPLCRENNEHLTEPPFIVKKEDPGRPTITCSIGPHVFHNAFCDLGASINITR